MTLSDLQTMIGSLTNDPNHDRYSTTDIGQELDNSMDSWNVEAKLIKSTTTITVVANTRQYAISNITGTIISIPRATHKGLPLTKRDKAFLDLYYGGTDWTANQGTPTDFYVDITDPANQYIVVYKNPQDNDAGANLVVEAVIRHTSMSATTDVPFMSGTSSNSILRPYDWGLAYEVSSRLLARDPNSENVPKASNYAAIGSGVRADIVQVFKQLERQEPPKLQMPMRWRRR
jgi:hypothetical protein